MKNPKTPIKVEIEFKPRAEKSYGGGFFSEWLSGKAEGIKFGLNAGAGLGNPLLTVWIEVDGKTFYYDADMRELMNVALIGRTP